MADDFLDEVLSNEPQTAVEEPEPVIEAAVEPEPEPEPQPEVEKSHERPEPGFVPIAAIMDERDKRKDLERQIAELRSQNEVPAAPDPYDDPQAYSAYMRGELDKALQAQKVDMSWQFAVSQHGEEGVTKAREWALEKAQKDPGFRAQLDTEFATQAMPIEWVVQQHRASEQMGKLGGKSLDDWFNEELARRNATATSAPVEVAAPVAIIPATKAAPPPRSIASDNGTATRAPVDTGNPMADLDAIFSR